MQYGVFSLSKVKHQFSIATKKEIFAAFVMSHLNFVILYFDMCSTPLRKRINKIYKQGIRHVVGAPFRSHTAQIFHLLEIMPPPMLHVFTVFRFMHKIISDPSMYHITHYWKPPPATSNLRNANKLSVPFCANKKLSKFPLFSFPSIYNKLIDIFNSNKINRDFEKLKILLIEDYYENNTCKLRNCFVCKKFNAQEQLKKAKDELDAKKLEELIADKKAKKAERYSRLTNKLRIDEYELLDYFISS